MPEIESVERRERERRIDLARAVGSLEATVAAGFKKSGEDRAALAASLQELHECVDRRFNAVDHRFGQFADAIMPLTLAHELMVRRRERRNVAMRLIWRWALRTLGVILGAIVIGAAATIAGQWHVPFLVAQ